MATQAEPREHFDEEWFADEVGKKVRELTSLCDTASKNDILVQISMITVNNVPAFRLDGVYKRLDKPLIYRV